MPMTVEILVSSAFIVPKCSNFGKNLAICWLMLQYYNVDDCQICTQ